MSPNELLSNSDFNRESIVSFLKRKPLGPEGQIHAIDPANAEWHYAGFSVCRLNPVDSITEETGSNEVILVMVEGLATVRCMTYLEETYYYRLNPAQGFGIQRAFTEDGSLDETMAVSDHDVVLVPRGHHPCAAPHGYELYYLNVMAGPRRQWRFQNHPDHAWLARPAKA